MRKFLTSVIALSAFMAFGVVARAASSAAVVYKAPTKTTVAPTGGLTGLSLTDLSTGEFDGEYPFYSPPFFAQPIPFKITGTSTYIAITVQMQDTFYTGDPTLSYVLIQGGKIATPPQTASFGITLGPGYDAAYTFVDTTPTTTGPATAIVTVTSGSQTIGTLETRLEIY
ncbi:hypothetical protein [Nevskia soli]|jgi:hypothetical protein|uniref:hypothetical protein n=1 Tax=Nevskia soli TaxID=418856 RepID=UPI0015D7A391|nr:hypothetical protein [Nevskia soli]